MRLDYGRKVREDLEEIKKKYLYSTNEDAFVHWCLRIISNTDDDDLCADSYTNGPKDLGIDGIMITEGDANNVIYFVQSKFVFGNRQVNRSEIREFVGNAVKVLKTPDFSLSGNNNIIRLGRDAKNILKEAPDTKIILCYCNSGKYAKNALVEINDWLRRFKSENEFKNFELRAYDGNSLLENYKANLDTSPMPPNVILPIVDGQIFEYRGSVLIDKEEIIQKAVVITTLASEIGNLRNREGRSLFSINVRYGLGPSNEVNKGMLTTLENKLDRDKFWFYNNGIYATCDKFEISADKKSIKINGLQIVNGCQTCTVFGEALQKNIDLSCVCILMRLVEGRKEKLTDNISRYTNTQNAVKARDLHSNDSIQDVLFQSFQDNTFFDQKFFYERKRGEMEHYKKTRQVMTRNRDKIDNKDVAQAFLAFFKLKPARAKASADILFRDNYTEIFDQNIEASNLFYPWYTLKIVKRFIKSQINISGQEYLSHSHSTLVAFVGYCFTKKFNMSDITKISVEFSKMKEDTFVKHVEHYLDIGVQVLNFAAMSKNLGRMPDQNFDARRFFLDQDLFEKTVIPAIQTVANLAHITEREIWAPPKI